MTKEYYQAHKEEIKEKSKNYYQAHKEEIKSYRKERKEEISSYQKSYLKSYRQTHKEELKSYRQSHKEYYKTYNKTYREEHKDKLNTYRKVDTNSSGVTKNNVRCRSRRYLFNTIKHTKLKGYEIHHCFGYENHKCFIYIPKELHLQIHQYLRDNGISADSNHFSQIVHLINAWNGYTYIKV